MAACPFHAAPANLRSWGWAELRALPGRYALGTWLAPFGPQRISEPCQTQSHRHSRQRRERLWKQRKGWRGHGPQAKQSGRPARQDPSAERGDAEQHAAEDVYHSEERP